MKYTGVKRVMRDNKITEHIHTIYLVYSLEFKSSPNCSIGIITYGIKRFSYYDSYQQYIFFSLVYLFSTGFVSSQQFQNACQSNYQVFNNYASKKKEGLDSYKLSYYINTWQYFLARKEIQLLSSATKCIQDNSVRSKKRKYIFYLSLSL